ncbi:MAG TPA: ABC transporter substrate-binding protein [Gaiellaceae bacterium]|nr:ABC transporter substrate-binding protein [Gaiellaceae bacterium]
MRRRLAATAALLVLGAVGCGERSEPLGELEQPYPVTVPGAGEQPVVIRERPERIVALDAGAAELVIALGARDRLVGVPAGIARGERPRQAPAAAAEVVSRAQQVRVSEIVRLEPDLIIATPAVDILDVTAAQRESEAALYVQPTSSVDDVVRATIELGFVVGEPVAARELAAQIRGQVAQIEEQVASQPVVTTFVDTGFFIPIQGRSLGGDLVRRARGESVAGESPGREPFPLNRLRRLDPQVYIATSDSRVTLGTLRSDPRTAQLGAVRERRVVVVPSDLLSRAGPRVGRALELVAEALHPDAVG